MIAPITKGTTVNAVVKAEGMVSPFSLYTELIRSVTAKINPVPVSISVPKRTTWNVIWKNPDPRTPKM